MRTKRSGARFPWLLPAVAVLALLLAACSGSGRRERVLKVGDQAPAFTATAMDGRTVSLEAYAGDPVVLRFFSPDCRYCKADTAVFNAYYDQYKDQGLKLVYINTDPDKVEAEKFVRDLGIAFPVILDKDRSLAGLYRVKVVPQTIVLSPRHTIVCAIMGGVGKAELDEILQQYLTP